jgi:SIR2-like domain
MDATGAKAVWILGSGFSAPLGGPLLSDLFRQETKNEILPFFREDEYPELAESLPWVQRTFHLGLSKGEWRNAEAYLAYVDDAYRDGSSAKHGRVEQLIVEANAPQPSDMLNDATQVRFFGYRARVTQKFDRLVKRGLASEVSRFLVENPPTSERWLPYRRWVRSLRPGFDTVVTFNYDTVVETAVETEGVAKNFWIGIPGARSPSQQVPVLKLHGSVNWRLRRDPKDGRESVEPTKDDLLKVPTENIAMAAPGGTKSDFVVTHFASLWANAEAALNAADMLFVVGYSFPDTDPTAQYRLLDAFAAGGRGEKAVHIVLGADVTPASRRMLSLIQSTARGRLVHVSESTQAKSMASSYLNIVRHPLGTQDFIGRHTEYTSTVSVI